MARLLEVNNLVTRFYTEDGVVHAVNGITYTLDEGESLGLVGESGCGKSVSVLSVMRLIPSPPGRIDDGEVIYSGRDLVKISSEEMRSIRGREIAMVFQDPMTSLNPVLTIGRQMTEGLRLHLGMNDAQAKARAAEMLELVGIPNAADRLNDYPHQFSGGMRQRVMIAMALSCNPSLLIADEPTTALDVTIQAQIVELVKQLQQKLGMAIIWITHDLGVVAGMVDRVAVMYAGYIVEMAPVRTLYENRNHPYTLGLLGSLPKLDQQHHERLATIHGLPPDLLKEPEFCPFAPRCPYVIEKCWQENPTLFPSGPNHYTACWRWEEITPELSFGEEITPEVRVGEKI
jgi:oligopeptide transport system ATP-binding protein